MIHFRFISAAVAVVAWLSVSAQAAPADPTGQDVNAIIQVLNDPAASVHAKDDACELARQGR